MDIVSVTAVRPCGACVTFRLVRWPYICVVTACLGVSLTACSHGSQARTSATSTTGATQLLPGQENTPPSRRPRTTRPAATAPHPDGNGATFAVPTSIAADCSVDVTPSLQSWLDGTPDNGVLAFPAGACYRIEDSLRLAHRRDLTIEGHGVLLEANTVGTGGRLSVRGRAQLVVTNSQNIVVRDVVVRGPNPHGGTDPDAYQPRYEAQHAFSLSADDGVTLDHVQAYDVYGDFVYIGGSSGTPSRHITVKNSQFARSGRQGISVTDGEDVDITDNSIGDVARSLFDLEPNARAQEVRRVNISGNTTGPVRNFWLANKGSGINIGEITVSRNVMRTASGGLVFVFGPAFGKRGPFVFTDNEFQVTGLVTDENARGVFVFSNVKGVELSKNLVRAPASRRMPAVELRGTTDVVLTGNRFTGTAQPVLADAASGNVHVAP